ncbi:MAG: response regulator transcription factor [Chloroflexia bacterium]|nr:response regulator transcription factor [Chloroflexia bacterium]
MKPVRVVLVDDHCIVRQGLRSILEPDPRFAVVGEAANGEEALRIVEEQRPDIVLLDIKLPDIGGSEVCRRIVEAHPQTAVLVLTAFLDDRLVDSCLRAGAQGYLVKDAEHLHLPERLLAVMDGHTALDVRAADILADTLRQQATPSPTLNPREVEILRLIAQGLTTKEIARKIRLSQHTVKGYVKEILSKMDARNRVEAVVSAKDRGLL